MKKRRIRWFYYLTVDAKAAEEYLNAQAAQGWALDSVFAGVAVFHPSDRRDLRYCVEPSGGRRVRDDDDAGQQRRWEYLTLCEDAGWRLEEETTTLRIFSSLPGRDPAPLQTDSALDFEANWNKVLRDQQWCAISIGAFWLVWHGFQYRDSLMELLLSPVLLYSSVLLMLYLLSQIGYGVYLSRRRAQCRRALLERGSLPVPAAAGARLRGLAPLAAILYALLFFAPLLPASPPPMLRLEAGDPYLDTVQAVRAGDLGLPEGSVLLLESGWLPMRQVQYQSISPQAMVVSDRYRCAAAPLARWAADLLVHQERTDPMGRHLHNEVDLSPVDLGFDEAWLGTLDDRQVLILREGTVAALVEGPVDFTDPGVLAAVRTCLKLEAAQ